MERLVEELQQAQPTYADIGATLAGVGPEGFHQTAMRQSSVADLTSSRELSTVSRPGKLTECPESGSSRKGR
jgi:hypothetical protein